MKVVAILGGLGSQMFKYAFYLHVNSQTEDKCYIDSTPFYTQRMWNGYELKKIFGIEAPDIVEFYKDDEVQCLGNNGRPYIINTLKIMKKEAPKKKIYYYIRGERRTWTRWRTALYMLRERFIKRKDTDFIDEYDESYLSPGDNIFYDEFNHTSDKYIKNEKYNLVNIFKFPEFSDEINRTVRTKMLNVNSVAIHIRRTDHLYDNKELYNTGYYPKAIKYIKEHVENPEFFIFSDDTEWCRENIEELGIGNSDKYYFIDWNKNEKSYCDMQLMTYCKHNILAISSFSWWGYYLSRHKEKVVCAPEGYWNEVSVHF